MLKLRRSMSVSHRTARPRKGWYLLKKIPSVTLFPFFRSGRTVCGGSTAKSQLTFLLR